jgi:RNA-directed DNA polymerase
MKRVGGIFERIADWTVLEGATWRAARGKHDRREVVAFVGALGSELAATSTALLSERYRFGPYSAFDVRDTKRRTIHAPSFRDRVVHHAIIAVTGPTFERSASPTSFACRSGKGHHAALAFARKHTHANRWYGKIDIEKFYDSVDHEVLMELLQQRFRERRLLRLFRALLASYEVQPGVGIPIGALTSQYLGNFLLDEVDRRMIASFPRLRLARYMDDMLVWGTQESLAEVRDHATAVLTALRLRMKHGGEWNRCTQGVPFLGFVLYPGRVRLGARGRRRLRRKLGALERRWMAGELSDASLESRGTSLFAHARHADDAAWRREAVRWSPLGQRREALGLRFGSRTRSNRNQPVPSSCHKPDADHRVHFPLEAGDA